jgi:hypothetical protein
MVETGLSAAFTFETRTHVKPYKWLMCCWAQWHSG